MRSFAIIILLVSCLKFLKAETGGAHFVIFGQLSQKDVKELIRHLNISHASRVGANVCIFINVFTYGDGWVTKYAQYIT